MNMTIVFVFKNGCEVRMKCKEFTIERNKLGQLQGWEAKGISENKVLEMDMFEILCVYRVLSDEEG